MNSSTPFLNVMRNQTLIVSQNQSKTHLSFTLNPSIKHKVGVPAAQATKAKPKKFSLKKAYSSGFGLSVSNANSNFFRKRDFKTASTLCAPSHKLNFGQTKKTTFQSFSKSKQTQKPSTNTELQSSPKFIENPFQEVNAKANVIKNSQQPFKNTRHQKRNSKALKQNLKIQHTVKSPQNRPKAKPQLNQNVKSSKRKKLAEQSFPGAFCILNVNRTKNNTHCSISSLFGRQKTLWSLRGGQINPGVKGRRKTRYTQRNIFKAAVEKLFAFGFKNLVVLVRGHTVSKRYIFKNFTKRFKIVLFKDLTGNAHNGCRPPKVRRV